MTTKTTVLTQFLKRGKEDEMMILEEAQEDNRRQNEEGELLRRVPRYHNLPLEESSLRFCLRCPMTARRKSPVSQDFFVRWSEREQ